ncbi:uncharacterized protein EV422DRAFT_521890 [Fimicolochytrium jonesii]|uniref:uncharacterized protein n=1 Tax=Fimicolochytrium jonesii TaxID=1396493 RepID=UPI0022FED6D2|nr:uncharacterized protein EV422DRAFT_521890 [Fimicolochytrium jonesii]KAI8823659.1 hypothetical protein EV422DRAFT_521890 [Fimicolochytrium jonesii]
MGGVLSQPRTCAAELEFDRGGDRGAVRNCGSATEAMIDSDRFSNGLGAWEGDEGIHRVAVTDSLSKNVAFPRTNGTHVDGGPSTSDTSPPPPRPPKSKRGSVSANDRQIFCSPDIYDRVMEVYTHIVENEYKGGANGRTPTEEYMVCDCTYEPGQDMQHQACGYDANCINRELYIECVADSCPAGQYCQNQKFQKRQYAPMEIFETAKKGFGLRATAPIRAGSFVIEYCGEVITSTMFKKRTQEYDKEGVKHFYFMSLKANEFIDAGRKGNVSRFMNHSCDPNCALHKWIVGERWRIGMFTLKDIAVGEEFTFDYKFKRYGAKAQSCYCGSSNCSGFIGGKQADELAIGQIADEGGDLEDDTIETAKANRRPKKGGDDSDYEGDLDARAASVRVHTMDDLKVLMRALVRNVSNRNRLIGFLDAVESLDANFQRRFIWIRGLTVLKWCLDSYIGQSEEIPIQVLRILRALPVATRNEKLEACIVKTAALPNVDISTAAKELLEKWSTLEKAYKIPKRAVPLQATGNTEVPKDSIAIPDATNSIPKRSYDEHDARRPPGSPPSKRYRKDEPVIKQEEPNRTQLEDSIRRHDYRSQPSYSSLPGRESIGPPRHGVYPERSGSWSSSSAQIDEYRRYPEPHRPEIHRVEHSRDYSYHSNETSYRPSRSESDSYHSYAPSREAYRNEDPRDRDRDRDRYRERERDRDRDDRRPPPPPSFDPDSAPPLPAGWSSTITPEGVIYYYDINNKTQWEFPTAQAIPIEELHNGIPASPSQPTDSAHSHSPPQSVLVEQLKHGAGGSSFSSSTDYPKKRKQAVTAYVVKVLSSHDLPPEIFKERAKQITRALVEKEIKHGHSARDTLSEKTKAGISEYVKGYCKRHNYARKTKSSRSRDADPEMQ